MELMAIIETQGSRLSAYTPDSLSPSDCLTLLSTINGDLFFAIRDEEEDVVFNLADIVNTHPEFRTLSDWDALLATDWLDYVTPVNTPCPPLLAYRRSDSDSFVLTDFFNGTSRLKCLGVDYTSRMRVTIGSTKEGVPSTRPLWSLHPDLKFEWDDRPAPPDTSQLIPVCGGALFKPQVLSEKALLALNARDTTRSVNRDTPEHMVLDFSSLGGMSIVSIADCTTTTNSVGDVTLVLPESVDTNKALMFVIGGSIKLPGEPGISRIGDKEYLFLDELVNHKINKLTNLKAKQKTIRYGSLALRGTPGGTLPSDENNFIIVLNTSRVHKVVYPQIFTHTGASVVFPEGVSGLLENRMTKQLRDYTNYRYTGKTVFNISPKPGVLVPKHQGPDGHLMRAVGFLSTRDNPTRYTSSIDLGWQCVEYLAFKGI